MNAAQRPDRGPEMDIFLAQIGWQGAQRLKLAADASFRRYERVTYQETVAVLMDAPPPWEDVRPFMAVTQQLADFGMSVPKIIAADEKNGFLLLEDLGDASFTWLLKANPKREADVYRAATDALVVISKAGHKRMGHLSQALKPYDMAVYLREAALLVEWFFPQMMGIEKAKALRDEYLTLWETIIAAAQLQQSCLVHRDYHADNLFWLANHKGYKAVGMLDYQDALLGDPAYDLASLLEDARRDVGAETVARCLEHFIDAMGEDEEAFTKRYSVLAAQRNAKIIGIFMRLCVRDGKAHYLDYLPRVWTHFMHDLNHPALLPMRHFIETHVPVSWRSAYKVDRNIGGIAL